jgi:hypothetical protein
MGVCSDRTLPAAEAGNQAVLPSAQVSRVPCLDEVPNLPSQREHLRYGAKGREGHLVMQVTRLDARAPASQQHGNNPQRDGRDQKMVTAAQDRARHPTAASSDKATVGSGSPCRIESRFHLT